MGESKEHDKLKETFIFILLFALIVLRFFPIGEDNTFIKSVGYIGVLFALVDLYLDADRRYGKIDTDYHGRGSYAATGHQDMRPADAIFAQQQTAYGRADYRKLLCGGC